MDIEQAIHDAIGQVAASRGLELPPLQSAHTLTGDLGLRSLDLAHLVAILEAELAVDPFARHVPITSIRTVGDVCSAYRQCLAGETVKGSDAGRAEGIARASARRQAAAEPRARR